MKFVLKGALQERLWSHQNQKGSSSGEQDRDQEHFNSPNVL